MTVTTATRRYTRSVDTIKKRVKDNMLKGSVEEREDWIQTLEHAAEAARVLLRASQKSASYSTSTDRPMLEGIEIEESQRADAKKSSASSSGLDRGIEPKAGIVAQAKKKSSNKIQDTRMPPPPPRPPAGSRT